MKKQLLLLIVAFFVSGTLSSLKAQISGQEFTHKVCDVNANSIIDLGKDIVGADLNLSGGEWHAVENTITTTNLAAYAGVNDSKYIETVTNVFSLVNKPVGTYSFVYTATNNACLPTGEKVLVKVDIAETAKPFAHTLNICDGLTQNLNLSSLLGRPLLGGTDVEFITANAINLPGSGVTGTGNAAAISIPSGWEGTFSLEYKYRGSKCDFLAPYVITVTRGVDGFELVNNAATYCVATMPNNINLTNLAGASVSTGVWTLATKPTTAVDPTVTTAGQVIFSDTPPVMGIYTFSYTYKDCVTPPADVVKTFTITITDDLVPNFDDKSGDICKSTDPTRVYNLLTEGFGINIPNNSGTWTVDKQPDGNTGLDISNGLFAIANARTGLYEFTYKISSAATDLCGLNDVSKKLSLTVGDVGGASVSDGRVQLCIDNVESATGNFTLTDFVAGLDKVTGVTWTGPTGTTITSGALPYSELKTLGVGVHMFEFTYNSAGCDDSDVGTGHLFVDITGELNMNDVNISYCRPDMPAALNLNQVIGVNVPGSWAFVGTAPTTASLADLATGTPVTGNKIVFKETAGTSGDKTYTIKFTPGSPANCGAVPVTVTLKVSDNNYN